MASARTMNFKTKIVLFEAKNWVTFAGNSIMIVPVENKIILGVDPGTSVMGYGLIQSNGNNLQLIQYGVVHLSKYTGHELKLKKIFERMISLLDEYKPDEMAIEAPFFGKNVQSMLKLGRAQGVAIAAALSREVPVVEYAPKKIKQSVTGNGNASKEQVAAMLQQMFKFKETPEFLDATDGLAVAVCHFYQKGNANRTNKSWSAFLKDNPERIVKK